LFVAVGGIAPTKSDLAIGKRDQAMVGDGHAMGVTAEILQHIFRAAEGRLQLHHPLFSKQCSSPSGEGLGICQQLQIGMEVELTILKSLFESVDEFAAEDFAQNFFRKKVVFLRIDPTGVIGREAAGGHDTMNVRVKIELLAPTMQDTEKTDLRTEVLWVANDFEKGFGIAAEQEIVDLVHRPRQGLIRRASHGLFPIARSPAFGGWALA